MEDNKRGNSGREGSDNLNEQWRRAQDANSDDMAWRKASPKDEVNREDTEDNNTPQDSADTRETRGFKNSSEDRGRDAMESDRDSANRRNASPDYGDEV